MTSCAEITDRLDDYLDGTLPPEEAHAVELHLGGCAECRAEEASLRRLLDAAADLPAEMAPPRDLWPGIEARLPPRGAAGGSGFPALAWAAALILALSGLLVLALRAAPGGEAPASARGPVPGTTAVRVSARGGATWRTADAAYQRAATALLATLDEQDLRPETRAVVDRNLAVIDTALNEIRAALAREPGNPALVRMLTATHQKKVDTLQRVLRESRT